ncbi:MAG: putative HTH-type transcriptional regulator YdfH, partial [Pseudomonadota bacterium]|jgi:DNA-binding GntR family transcriptional regulator
MLPWLTPDTPDRLKAVRETSLAKLVRDDLLQAILQGDLPPGARINEPDVCARLQVSRVPVREALRELESSGLVVSRKHAGVFVRTIEADEVGELYEMRSILDAQAGWRAAALPLPERAELVQALQDSIALMHAASAQRDLAAYYQQNLHFHWLIMAASGNRTMGQTYQALVQRLHLARLKNLAQDFGMRTSIAEHERIAQAIDQGEAESARRLLAEHVSGAHQRLLQGPRSTPPKT